MKLEKAIEILEILSDGTVEHIYNERADAIGLGIEALKKCQERSDRFPHLPHLRLPSETSKLDSP